MLKKVGLLYEKFPDLTLQNYKSKSVFISHPLLVSPAHFITPLLLSETLNSAFYPVFIAASENFQHYQSVMKKVAGGLNLFQKVEADQLLYIDLFGSGSSNLHQSLPLAASFPPTFTDSLPTHIIHAEPSDVHKIMEIIRSVCQQKKDVLLISDSILQTLHTGGGVNYKGVLGFINEVTKLGTTAFWTWNQGLLLGDEEDEEEELGWKCCAEMIQQKADIRLKFKENLAGFSLDVDGAIEIELAQDSLTEKLGGREKENRREIKYKVGEHGMEVFFSAQV